MRLLILLALALSSVNAYLVAPGRRGAASKSLVLRLSGAGRGDAESEHWDGKNDMSKGIIPTGKDLGSGRVNDGSSALARMANEESLPFSLDKKTPSEKAKKYIQMVESLTPNEMLMKFTQKSPKNVQEAAKSTVMSVLGTLPSYALDAAIITTSSKLANLIYQMQLTGYMLKNA